MSSLTVFQAIPDDAYSPAIATVLARVCAATYLPSGQWRDDATVKALGLHAPIDNQEDAHCLLGDIPGTGLTILAFRGTGPISTQNWLADFQIRLEQQGGSGEVRIHEGFAATLASLLPAIKSDPSMKQTLWIAGHSLGGALATLACSQLNADGFRVQATYTFGGPRVGNAAFAESLPAPLYRFVYGRDLVPHLPPRGVYQHGGIQVRIDPDGTLKRASLARDEGDDDHPGVRLLLAPLSDPVAVTPPLFGGLEPEISEVAEVLPNPQRIAEALGTEPLIEAFIADVTGKSEATVL